MAISFVPTSKEIPQHETEAACNGLFNKDSITLMSYICTNQICI